MTTPTTQREADERALDLDKLLIQAETTAILGSEKHCRDLLLAIAKVAPVAAPEAPAHETIVQEGSNLVCTACGTTAPTDTAATDQPSAGSWQKSTEAES